MEFYSVKHREKIQVADDQVYKVHYKRASKEGKDNSRYAVGAEVEHKGSKVKLTKFVSKEAYDKLDAPEREA